MVLIGPNGAGKTNLIEAISLLAPGRGLRRATLDEVAFSEGDGSWAVSAEVEGTLGLATLGTGIEPPAGEDAAPHAQMPHRPRAGRLGRGLRRSSARGLADAGDGPAVQRPGVRAAALPRPAGARGRRRALQPRHRARARAALAQPPARGAAPRSALARRRSSTRPPSSRSRWRRSAPRRCSRLQGALAAAQATPRRSRRAEIALDGWMEQLLPDHPAVEIEDRYRARAAATTARATPPPAARSTARISPISP